MPVINIRSIDRGVIDPTHVGHWVDAFGRVLLLLHLSSRGYCVCVCVGGGGGGIDYS